MPKKSDPSGAYEKEGQLDGQRVDNSGCYRWSLTDDEGYCFHSSNTSTLSVAFGTGKEVANRLLSDSIAKPITRNNPVLLFAAAQRS
jgi:hypothetical protein